MIQDDKKTLIMLVSDVHRQFGHKIRELEKHNEYINTSNDYNYTSGTIQNNVSLTNSLIAAYRVAGKEIKYNFLGYIVHSVFGLEKSAIELGDIIIKCEGVELTEEVTISSVLASKYGTYEKDTMKLTTNDKQRYIYKRSVPSGAEHGRL